MKNEFIGLNNFYETKDVGKKNRDLEGGFYRKKQLIFSGYFDDVNGCFFYD